MSMHPALDASKRPGRRDDWGTPQWLFDRLDREFSFDLDAAASKWNAKCARYLTDALGDEPWPGQTIWLNPPYKKDILGAFLGRAWQEVRGGKVVVVLLPVRSEMGWWHDLVINRATEIRFIRGRVAFEPPPGYTQGPAGRLPVFASAVIVYKRGRGRARLTSLDAPRNHVNLVAGQRELCLDGKR